MRPSKVSAGKPASRYRRRVLLRRRALAVGDGDQLDPAGLDVRLHDRERADIGLDAAFADIGDRPHHVAIRHARDVQARALEIAVEDHVGHPGRGRIVQLAGLRFDLRDEVLDGVDLQRRRDDQADQRVRDARDRPEIVRVVRHLRHQERMRGERRGRRVEQRVIVLGTDKGVDGDDGVAAGAVLDHDRLLPFRGQLVGDQTRGDIGAAAGAERHNEADRPLRPALGLRLGGRPRCEGGGDHKAGHERAKRLAKSLHSSSLNSLSRRTLAQPRSL